MRQFPHFRVFPGNVHRVTEVQQQSFASVKKAEAEKIVIDEGHQRTHCDIYDAESRSSLGDRHFCPQRGIAVHVGDIVGDGGITVVQESALLESGGCAADLKGLVHGAVFKAPAAATKEAQLGIGPEASMFDPPAEEFILAADPNPCDCLLAFYIDAIR